MDIEPKVGTMLNIAVAQQRLGRTASAWASFKTAATLARRAGQQERESFAQQSADDLAPKLSRVLFSSPGLPPNAVLKLDGIELAVGTLGAPIPLDPGKHDIVVTATGKTPWSTSFTVPDGPSKTEVSIPPLEDVLSTETVEPAPTMTAQPPTAAVTPRPATVGDGGAGYAIMVYTGFGVGAAGLLLGAITGGIALSQSSDLEEACPAGACPVAEHDKLDTMTALSHVSTAGFVVAGAGAVVGVIGLFLWQGDTTEQARLSLTPLWTIGDAAPSGLSVGGSF